ncbi:MAG: type II toxin-antitoxin system mRNA interferase toxin, RelE/StbE family [bacterium]|nr:type II toxin-antitoxin system mRNA interferase toxin, RelE/StbE family [bacterium]
MEIFYTSRFKREAKKLSKTLRPVVEERFLWFQENPSDPRLHMHKLRGGLRGFCAFSINATIRVIFEFDGKQKAVFHSIGDHSIYD